jgi:2-polyprenyl-6-methoxyphenol hydroxylase-like FAD-dependent oxidoreductase
MNSSRYPVLIVGAGVGGLATSALLAKHRIPSLLLEKRREVFIYPKARNLSFRSLEVLRGLGVGDAVHAIADGVSSVVVRSTLSSTDERQALDVDAIFAGMAELSPEPAAQYCPQSELEPILLAYVREHGSEARYGTELMSFEQQESAVTAVLRDLDTNELETVRADYLVAADGVHSPIRQTLGLDTSGYGALPIYVVFVYFRGPWRAYVPQLENGDAVQIENPSVQGLFLSIDDDRGMFITTYYPDKGETAAQFTPQRCREMIRNAIGEDIDIEILQVAPWQPYEQVADQFRCGRVFLVGDSAHTMPPLKAGGANTAIQSAHNLAWKLAAVIDGSAEPPLLDTFDDERHPVGSFSARQSLTGPSLGMLGLDRETPGLPAGEEAAMFDLLIGYQYRSTAVVSGDPATADHGVHLVGELRGQPGTRVPHAWLCRGNDRISTLDLLGPGFTVLAGDAGVPWCASAALASCTLGVPVTVHRIGTDGDLVDVDGQWAARTGLAPEAALLVRPDDVVGWRVDSLPEDPDKQLCQALSAILGRGQNL